MAVNLKDSAHVSGTSIKEELPDESLSPIVNPGMIPNFAQVHAVFLCHGLWGKPEHMFALRDALQKRAKEEDWPLEIFCCRSYQGTRSYDGVDVCADRVFEEIHHEISQLRIIGKEVDKFSILGYSLGGLIARQVMFLLSSAGFFDHVEACNFTTFASPAIGIPIIPGPLSSAVRSISAFFLSRSGAHLYLKDHTIETGNPLVQDLADAEHLEAVAHFSEVDIYANTILDRVVPYRSGGIHPSDPFLPSLAKTPKETGQEHAFKSLHLDSLHLSFDQHYPGVVTHIRQKGSDASKQSPSEASSLPAPSLADAIRSWFTPATYPFLPYPLGHIMVCMIPLVFPAIFIVLGTFTVQSIASRWRIRNHFKSRRRIPTRHHSLKTQDTDTYDAASALEEARTRISVPLKTPVTSSSVPYDLPLGHVPGLISASTYRAESSPTAYAPTVSTHVNVDLSGVYDSDQAASSQAALPQMQIDMIDAMTASIPHMRKHLTFFPGVFTSHTIIVCQDPKNKVHQRGLGVVQHWADHFAP